MADILEKYPSLKKFEGIDDEDIVEVSKIFARPNHPLNVNM